MKKAIIFLLLVSLALGFNVIAYAGSTDEALDIIATDIDLKSMSDDELLALNSLLNKELFERGIVKGVEIPGGRYVVGEDIPAGNYTITIENRSTNLTVWGAAYDDYSTNGGLLLNIALYADKNPALGKVVLEEGNVIDFTSPLVFQKFMGFTF